MYIPPAVCRTAVPPPPLAEMPASAKKVRFLLDSSPNSRTVAVPRVPAGFCGAGRCGTQGLKYFPFKIQYGLFQDVMCAGTVRELHTYICR